MTGDPSLDPVWGQGGFWISKNTTNWRTLGMVRQFMHKYGIGKRIITRYDSLAKPGPCQPHPAVTAAPAPIDVTIPVYGSPGYVFDLVHISALVSLAISILFSAGVIISFIRAKSSFARRNIGERLVLYLAVCDMGFSVSHTMDHAYMFAVRGHPPDIPCTIFAYCMTEFIFAQSLVVGFTAINAFMLVVREKKLSLGYRDWRLIVTSFGLPAALLIPLASLGLLGQSGTWCYADLRKPTGIVVNFIFSSIHLMTFLTNIVCYMLVWRKIRHVAAKTRGSGVRPNTQHYQNTARILMLFVIVYMFQWFPWVVYSVWSLIAVPHPACIVSVVILCNMGGVFNFLAYTFVRKRLQRANQHTTLSTCASHVDFALSMTNLNSQHLSMTNLNSQHNSPVQENRTNGNNPYANPSCNTEL